jgi:eukaryotic-like serine/threonine-protein kinase
MSITAGTRLGPYEILAPAGAGGMGDVYRARDTRLDREVALKTIKGPFTERFEREARAISALNHPNICTLYDVGQHEGSGYLVMEYIEGKPVAGPMPVDQAIALGVRVCEALDAAHKKGIVHRDLKPANILQTRTGVKLLDFGLAKLAMPGGSVVLSGPGANTPADQATVAALTGAHTVVGTPQYMAPEQIEGKEVDARSDIFAFGCVLYELLTGVRAFEGKSASTVMAAVLATAPRPISQVVPLTPPALERIVSRCLAKDPDERWQTIRDVASELRWVAQGGSQVGLPAVVATRRRTRQWLAWGVAAVASLAMIGFASAWMRRAPVPPPVVRFVLPTPEGLTNPGPPALSPDGRAVVFSATDAEGKRMLWVRSFDAFDARPLNGSAGTDRAFWSPDSRFVAFVADGKLKKMDISGGPPQTICDAPTGSDGTWSTAGVILFDGRGSDPIWRVPATGGVAKPEVTSEGGQGAGWPVFLPDGNRYLYMDITPAGEQTLRLGTLDQKGGRELFKTASRVLYADPGYFIFVREQTLVAQRVDPSTLEPLGEPLPLAEGLGIDSVGLAAFDVSRTGVLIYRAGELERRRLLWTDRTGKQTPAFDAPGDYRDVSFAPDGTRLVFDMSQGTSGGDLWIRDLARGVSTRFTFDPAVELVPLWSPDGRRIVFTSRAKGPGDLYVKDASGTRDPELLLASPDAKFASDWSKDGRFVLYAAQTTKTGFNIWALPFEGDKTPFALVATKFDELSATFSPDGKYVAYMSNESGRPEVYVQEFPEARNKWQVSTDGGSQPFWRADGKELYYRSRGRVMAVPVLQGATFSVGTPQELFKATFANVTVRAHYRPTADGQRFLVLAPLAGEAIKPASVVLNWPSALRN